MAGIRPWTVKTAIALLVLGVAGCASEPEQAKQADNRAPSASVSQGSTGTTTTQGDVKTLVDGRAQDAKVLDDANKAIGALHP